MKEDYKEMFKSEWFDKWFENCFGDKENFSPLEIACVLRVSKNSIYRAIKEGKLEAIKCENRFIIPRDALRKYLLERNTILLDE